MIEQIQKYKIIITIALVAVGAGFLLGGSDLKKLGGAGVGGTPVLKIAGRTYDDREFQLLGSGSLELASTIASGDFSAYQFLGQLTMGATTQAERVEKFFIGRMLLRQAKDEFGVYPGADEVSDYIRGLQFFANHEGQAKGQSKGQFNEEFYRQFISKNLGRFGMAEGDLRELVADMLAAKKINAILGLGLDVNREIVAQMMALEQQQITGNLARLDIDPFEAKIEPTEEQIKTYWEERQDAFMTEPLRKFTYVIVSPQMPADPEADKPEPPESIADAAASDEVKKAAAKKKEEEKAKRKAELAEERLKIQSKLDELVDDFSFELEQKNSDFEALVKKNNWEAKTTEMFTQSKPPKELDFKLRTAGSQGKSVDELFKIEELASDPMSKYTQPIAIGENQWLIARLDGQEKARPKTFDEAKMEARVQYITEKATEAMKAGANEAATKIKAALAAGKSFADAAKDAGITHVKEVTKVNSSYRPDAATEPKNLFEAGRNVDAGALAEVIIESDRAFIFHVAKREVVKETDAATRIDGTMTSLTNSNTYLAFSSWLAARTEAAKIEQLYKQ